MGTAPQAPVPDVGAITQQSGAANLLAGEQSQAASNVNQITPFGSLSYAQTGTGPGGIPTYTATTKLSPQEQAIFNAQLGTQQTAGTAAEQLLKGANYGSTNPTTEIGNMTSGLTGQQMSDYMASVAPYQQQALASEEAQLANQGLTPGNHAYDLAMQNFVQGQNQANLGAAAQFQPTAFNEATQLYGMPLETAASLYGIGQPASVSGNLINTPTASVNPADVTGAYGLANQANLYNAGLAEQQYGSMLGGLSNLGSAAIKALPFL